MEKSTEMPQNDSDDDPFGKKFEEKFNHHFPKHVSIKYASPHCHFTPS
jgi:hypothetical protein